MRVLLNALQASNLSGTGRYTLELMQGLLLLGSDLDLHVFWPENLEAPVENPRLHIHKRKAGNANRIITDQIGLREFLRHHKLDIVHYPANIGPVTGKHKLVLTVHDLSFIHNPQWFRPDRAMYYNMAARASLGNARRIIADSRHTASEIERHFKIPAEIIDVVYLGVDPMFMPVSSEHCDAVKRKYALPKKFFLYLGTMEPRKNLPRLIHAWTKISRDTDWDLVIAGRKGWKTKSIDDAVGASPLSNRIHFPGFIEQQDLPALLNSAQTFVWPSLYEGFGLPPLEAMACGVPVLTSNTTSIPEVVADAALTVSPEDGEALAASMLKLYQEESLREVLKEKGIIRAQKFNWESTSKGVLSSYTKALAG